MRRIVFIMCFFCVLSMVSCSDDVADIQSELEGVVGMDAEKVVGYWDSKNYTAYNDGSVFIRWDDVKREEVVFYENGNVVSDVSYIATPIDYCGMGKNFVIRQLESFSKVDGGLFDKVIEEEYSVVLQHDHIQTSDFDDCVDKGIMAINLSYDKDKDVEIEFFVMKEDYTYKFEYSREVTMYQGNYDMKERLRIIIGESW